MIMQMNSQEDSRKNKQKEKEKIDLFTFCSNWLTQIVLVLVQKVCEFEYNGYENESS